MSLPKICFFLDPFGFNQPKNKENASGPYYERSTIVIYDFRVIVTRRLFRLLLLILKLRLLSVNKIGHRQRFRRGRESFYKKILFSCSFMTSITFYFRLFVLNNKLTHVGIAICVVFSLLNYSIFNCLSLTNYYIKKSCCSYRYYIENILLNTSKVIVLTIYRRPHNLNPLFLLSASSRGCFNDSRKHEPASRTSSETRG